MMSLHSCPLKRLAEAISRVWNYTLEKFHWTLTHSIYPYYFYTLNEWPVYHTERQRTINTHTELCSVSVSVRPVITSFSLGTTPHPTAGSTHWNFFTAALFSWQPGGRLNSSSVLAETWNNLKEDLIYLSPFFFFFALLYSLHSTSKLFQNSLMWLIHFRMWVLRALLHAAVVRRSIFFRIMYILARKSLKMLAKTHRKSSWSTIPKCFILSWQLVIELASVKTWSANTFAAV